MPASPVSVSRDTDTGVNGRSDANNRITHAFVGEGLPVAWRLYSDRGTECSTLFDGAVSPEDDDVLRCGAQLRYRERTSGGIVQATAGLEVLAVDSDDPPSSYAKHPDLAGFGLAFNKEAIHVRVIGAREDDGNRGAVDPCIQVFALLSA
jgi:hypothetical protein